VRASAETAPREPGRAVEMARAAHAGMLRPDAELMNLGVYASSPKLPIKVHDYGMSYKSIVQWIKLRTFLFFRGRALSPASRLPWIPRRAVLVVAQLAAEERSRMHLARLIRETTYTLCWTTTWACLR